MMPRYPRVFLPDMPVHIVHRGHDRQPIFSRPGDYSYYLANVIEMKSQCAVRVFGYCLMTNHVHLVVAPHDDPTLVSQFMRTIAARQTRHINKRKNRTGTLWDGRFKASLIDTDAYLLACLRYVDLNPVRAALVTAPENYRWSSYRCHSALAQSAWLDEHESFRALGESQGARGRAYREFVMLGITDSELTLIRQAVHRNQLTGGSGFGKIIAERTGHRIRARGPGRPCGTDRTGRFGK